MVREAEASLLDRPHEGRAGYTDELERSIQIPDDGKDSFSWRKLWAFTGPGWLMSIAYLDPGNLESDLQAGATAGYHLLWVLLWATILGCVLQILCVRLGVVTGKHLAQHCRTEYKPWTAFILWIMAELAIIGSDIQEVIGSAIAMKILFGIEIWAGVLITAMDTFTFLFLTMLGLRKLEYFFAMLISTMVGTFAWEFGIGDQNYVGIAIGTIVPNVPRSALVQAVSMLGAVIMPHNLFLHSALVQSRDVDNQNVRKVKEANFYFSIESAISLFVSFIINLLLVSVFAAGFYYNSAYTDEMRSDIDLLSAGTNLRQRFGEAAELIWAIGLLAAGQSSTMTGTFAGQFVMQGFLDLHIKPWKRTLITRSIAIVPTIVVAVSFRNSLNGLDQYLNVLQSIQLPFAILPLLAFCSNESIMGQFTLSRRASFAFSMIVVLVITVNIYLVLDSILANKAFIAWWGYLLLSIAGTLYLGFIAYLCYERLYRPVKYSPMSPV